jgi:hypothetical protein
MTALSFFFSIESQSMSVHDAREQVRPAHAILAGIAGNAYCMQTASVVRIDALSTTFERPFLRAIYFGFSKETMKSHDIMLPT